MAFIYFSVPVDAQETSDTCWHSCAQMIWWFWQGITGRQGPMNTLGKHYEENRPVTAADFIPLAQKVGMREVPRYDTYDDEKLRDLLQAHGPLWCAGYWYGYGHVIVLTGVDSSGVYYNDPDGGVRMKQGLAWFNTKLANVLPGCLMSKDPKRY